MAEMGLQQRNTRHNMHCHKRAATGSSESLASYKLSSKLKYSIYYSKV